MLDTIARVDPASFFDDKPLCEHCRTPFEPRSGKGGKPQRFCSQECRRAFHSESEPQRGPTPPTPIAENSPAVPEQPEPIAAPAATAKDSEDFDWVSENNEDVVLREQQAIAIYRNTYGGLVIRQHEGGFPGDHDTIIVINRENIGAFVDRLTEVAGVPSFP